ncbi:hypothetical protein [Rhizobium leguminosarum]|uniref:hypothetical protein n=1 Tax=Rhizobium leguminosarum TaxID=384 RepID=UPI003ECEBC89
MTEKFGTIIALNAASRILILLVEKGIISNEEATEALNDIATPPADGAGLPTGRENSDAPA